MAKSKKRVLIICGGESAERDVSLISARTVFNALDAKKYDKKLIWISPKGLWIKKSFKYIDKFKNEKGTVPYSGPPSALKELGSAPVVVIPILHGPGGEDGALQGFLETLHLPYVGCGVLGSALGMDKEFAKVLAARAGIPVLPSVCIHDPEESPAAARTLGFPIFVKPARLGSSVGVSRVDEKSRLAAAVLKAFQYDEKIILEKAVPSAREIECAVLGDPYSKEEKFHLRASIPGEVVPRAKFYDYQTKYLTADGAARHIPAKINASQTRFVQSISLKIFGILDCRGMGRVDFLMDGKTGKIYFNEINTIPGFTPTSMYPALWKASGIPTPRLLDILIDLALRRKKSLDRLKKSPFD